MKWFRLGAMLLVLAVAGGLEAKEAKIDYIAQAKKAFGKLKNNAYLNVDTWLEECPSKQLPNFVAYLVDAGLGHGHPKVFLKVHAAFVNEGAARPEIFDALIKLKLKTLASKNPETLSAIFNILLNSDKPKHWAAAVPFVDHKVHYLGMAATILVGQGIREAAPKLAKSVHKFTGRRLTITVRVLERLTGGDFRDSASLAKRWLEDGGDKKLDEKPMEREEPKYYVGENPKMTNASYFGTKIEYANIMFCMDTSKSMKPDEACPPLKTPSTSNFPTLPKGNDSKIWNARLTLCGTLKALPNDLRFGIITFGGRLDGWKDGKMHPSVVKNRVDAYKWTLTKTPLSLGTALAQSVMGAMRQEDVEIVYLMTDGAPFKSVPNTLISQGNVKFKVGEADQAKWYNQEYILDWTKKLHITRLITFNTVKIGDFPGQFLSSIAAATEGTFKFVHAEGMGMKKKKKN